MCTRRAVRPRLLLGKRGRKAHETLPHARQSGRLEEQRHHRVPAGRTDPGAPHCRGTHAGAVTLRIVLHFLVALGMGSLYGPAAVPLGVCPREVDVYVLTHEHHADARSTGRIAVPTTGRMTVPTGGQPRLSFTVSGLNKLVRSHHGHRPAISMESRSARPLGDGQGCTERRDRPAGARHDRVWLWWENTQLQEWATGRCEL